MKKLLTSLVVLAACGLLSQPLWAMRCGNYLIQRNDHVSKIERYCDEPVSYVSSTSFKTISRWDHFYHIYFYEEVPVLLEEMVFNFGTTKFMRLVKLENGIVKEVKTLGYGYLE